MGPWQLIDGDFRSTIAVTATRKRLYMIDEDSGLYPVVPETGQSEEAIDTGWSSRSMTTLGDRLFIAEASGTLYRITNGTCDSFDESWRDVTHLTATTDRLFAITDHTLYSIDPDTGAHQALENSWDPTHLIGVANELYAFEGSALYRVDPETGACTELANSWCPTAVATAGGELFAIDGGMLYKIDATGGAHELCAANRTRLLVGCGGWLYSIEDGGELYRLPIA